jgi:hypothetical protein
LAAGLAEPEEEDDLAIVCKKDVDTKAGGGSGSGKYLAKADVFRTPANAPATDINIDATYPITNGSISDNSNVVIGGAITSSTTAAKSNITLVGKGANTTYDNTVAVGAGATASGSNATVLGSGATASAISSTALGYKTEATSSYSTAIGYQAKAKYAGVTAVGFQASGGNAYSTTFGYNATTVGTYSTIIGYQVAETGSSSTSQFNTLMGCNLSVTGKRNVIIGAMPPTVSPTGDDNTVVGYNAKSMKSSTTSTVSTTKNVAVGSGAYVYDATDSVAIGYQANSTGSFSIVIGSGCSTSVANTVVIGKTSVSSVQLGPFNFVADGNNLKVTNTLTSKTYTLAPDS